MSSERPSPQPEGTPSYPPTLVQASSVPQKRALEDDHQPAISSPLNPDFRPSKPADDAPLARERASRAKKESLKKRESKGPLTTESSARSTPDPKGPITKQKKKAAPPAPTRYKLPAPKLSDFEAPKPPIFVDAHEKMAPDGRTIAFKETTEHVYNKRSFHYVHCIADPAFPSSQYYRQTEAEPFGPRFAFEDKSSHMFLDESGKHITTDRGFRMAKANVGVRQGRWYWECKITSGIPNRKRSEAGQESTNGHVRMGWARREATLDAPVGFDAYSYGLRDAKGQKVFMSRPKDFFPPGQEIQEGDVIGLEINLPSETLHRKVVEGQYNPAVDLVDDEPSPVETAHIIRERVPIRFKAHLYFERIDYHPSKELEDLMNPSPVISSQGGLGGATQKPGPTHPSPALRTLPHSSIKVYKNGVLMGTPFTDLLAFLPPASKPSSLHDAREGLDDGMLGYYPAVSVFRGGAAEVNFGPDFWYPPPDYGTQGDVEMTGSDQAPSSGLKKLRAIGERYDEQIVEDIVYDIVDEVDFWLQDGGVSGKGATAGVLRASAGVPTHYGLGGGVVGSEIKELVQDDE
ncbi:Concanavalin A-like lectins/glucanase [Glarea lozoyensis ATCC 20868]|uniref:Concanavalin A-like lectins/glucanase n=1 Tax=Glarea lozoyensis (strain ATCC 20868 / MF5171) TaxID=1116229 RepID=S3CC75_GLAL2|nr:Concanavalin A-like lectins/glucanase [Glarea lozoyensis ATCC 20868]EPE24172.1 Concanavalin A-like lectins/glucanase [Glarea lozoyensis ATCC 20868]